MRELSLHILDLLENALEAGSTRVEISIDEDLAADRLTFIVRDNGQGMDSEKARRAVDPFFTTRATRHVGLGVPLLAAAAERCDGYLSIEAEPGQGTAVTAVFRRSHLDRAPLGNLTDTLLAFLLNDREGEAAQLRYHHRVNDLCFDLDTAAIQAEVGAIPLSYPPLREWLRDYIAGGEAELAQPGEGGTNVKAQDD